MFYFLAEHYTNMLNILNIFHYTTFRLAGAVLTSLIIMFLISPKLINWLRIKQGKGQPIRLDGPQTHLAKAGTPTMGGFMILISTTISSLMWINYANCFVWILLFIMIAYGFLGFLDDYLKVMKKTSDGLSGKLKLLGQFVFGVITVFLIMYFQPSNISHTLEIPFFKKVFINFGSFFPIVGLFIIVGSSNAVNLTDGLDGLAAVPIIIATSVFIIIAYAIGHLDYAHYLQFTYIPNIAEVAVFCGSLIGATMGFLWYNAKPAEIFMGDTGSLAIGGVLGSLALITKHEIVWAVVGGVFVMETVSVILQVGSYKLRKKRIFKMAPIHHHFEQLGWAETKVVVRFWILAIIFAILGLITLKLR